MYPSYIINNNNGNTNFSTIHQQSSTIYNHQTPNLMITNIHYNMDQNSTNNNTHVNLENNKNKSSRKDHHSKIKTAQGLKDRRIRLSLDVAKKFFKLQDLLGFDKGSNTIQWLLMNSKHAIQDLQPQQLKNNSLAKEARDKARERARKRTTEKRNIKLGVDRVVDPNTNLLEPWIPFGVDQVQLTDQAEYPSSHFQFKQGMPSLLFNYHHNFGYSHEHQGSDTQILGKPIWKASDN